MDLKLKGKVALVTGSSSGIGKAVAERLADEGVKVIVHGRNLERLQSVVDEIRERGGEAESIVGEMLNAEDVEQIAESALEAFGRVDILVNNAGGRKSKNTAGVLEGLAGDWVDTFQINVMSMLVLSQRLSVGMRARGWGRIINVSSAAGSIIRKQTPPDYGAAKAAINSLTLSLANGFVDSGVSVVTVSPGPILTPSLEGFIRNVVCKDQPGISFAEAEKIAAKRYFNIPLGRLGRADEVAAIIATLASSMGGFCHGTNVHIDGGSIGMIN